MTYQPDCVVLGGGVGGCLTAMELSDAGFTVAIIEKELQLMKGTSDVTPGRMGLGFHYIDLRTAIFYLRATVRFTRLYGHFRDAAHKPLDHPLRRGRYFILKSSRVPPEDILNTYEGIKQEYARLVADDQQNEVYGPPSDLFRLLDQAEYADDVPCEIVQCGIETAEESLDWARFRKHVVNEIEKRRSTNQIKVFLATEARNIQQLRDNIYKVCCVTPLGTRSATISFMTERLVNCTWQNIAALNATCGLSAESRLNRVKIIATIQLPPEMENAHSMFFCMGPYAMFTNKGHGVGAITFAPITNKGLTTLDSMPQELEDVLSNLTAKEKRIYGESILNGVSTFIPKLASAKLLNVKTGVVQTYLKGDQFQYDVVMGNTDFIHEPSSGSGIERRDYNGVEVLAPGYVVNACMKLLFCVDNAKTVRKIFTDDNNDNI